MTYLEHCFTTGNWQFQNVRGQKCGNESGSFGVLKSNQIITLGCYKASVSATGFSGRHPNPLLRKANVRPARTPSRSVNRRGYGCGEEGCGAQALVSRRPRSARLSGNRVPVPLPRGGGPETRIFSIQYQSIQYQSIQYQSIQYHSIQYKTSLF